MQGRTDLSFAWILGHKKLHLAPKHMRPSNLSRNFSIFKWIRSLNCSRGESCPIEQELKLKYFTCHSINSQQIFQKWACISPIHHNLFVTIFGVEANIRVSYPNRVTVLEIIIFHYVYYMHQISDTDYSGYWKFGCVRTFSFSWNLPPSIKD